MKVDSLKILEDERKKIKEKFGFYIGCKWIMQFMEFYDLYPSKCDDERELEDKFLALWI